MPEVLSIVTGRLKPVGATKVTKSYSSEVAKEIAKFKKDIRDCQEMVKAYPDELISTALYESAQKKLKDFLAKCQKIVTTVREYVDSEGARYIETVQKDGSSYMTGTPVRKLEKFEESFMPDGRKIKTVTIHDKSDMFLLGEGYQDGMITKIEEITSKDGAVVGRKTTKQLASGYGGKTVQKEGSVDGQELNAYNTKTTFTDVDSNGVKYRKTTYEPGDSWLDCGFEVDCNEHGIPQVLKENIKPGW